MTRPHPDTTAVRDAVVLGGPELVLAIDQDCPACSFPERTLTVATGLFGCTRCVYVSKERCA